MSKVIDKGFFVNCGDSEYDDFFEKWIEYTKPKHSLTRTEQRVLAGLLRHRYELLNETNSDKKADELFLKKEHRDYVRASLGMSGPQFNGIISKLKDLRILTQNKNTEQYKMDPNFIVTPDKSGSFKLLMVFKYSLDAPKKDKEKANS